MLVQVAAYLQVPVAECPLGLGEAHRPVRVAGFQQVLVAGCPPARGAVSRLAREVVFRQGPEADFQLAPEVGCVLDLRPILIAATYLHGQFSLKNSKTEVCSIMPTSSNPICDMSGPPSSDTGNSHTHAHDLDQGPPQI